MARARRQPKPLSFDRIMRQYMASTFMTPGQIRKEARRETNLALKDSMRQVRYQSGRAYEEAKRQQNTANVMGQILASYRSSDAAAMANAFSSQRQQMEMMNQGLLDPTIAAQQAGVQAGQQASEKLAGYEGAIPTMPSPAANALTARQLGISIPSELLSTLGGAAYEQGLAGGSAQASRLGQMATQELDQRLKDIKKEYAAATREVLAKRPEMIQEALTNLRSNARSDFASIINAMYLKNTMAGTEAELTGTYRGKLTPAERERRQKAALAQMGQAAEWERIAISRMNARTSRMRAKIAQQQARLEASGQTAETTGDLVSLQQDFRDAAKDWVQDIIQVDRKKGRPRNMPPSQQTLINGIFRLYGRPLVGRYGLSQQQLSQWAAQVVSAFPKKYWNPRTYGRGVKTTSGKGGKPPSGSSSGAKSIYGG
jgi:hypothetical protein